MSNNNYIVEASWLTNVADAIRSKKSTTEPILYDDFASEIEGIESGSEIVVEPLSITENGTYIAPEGEAYSPITVNVPETPTQEKTIDVTANGTVEVTADEGKVLTKVTANVNVPNQGGDGDKFNQLVTDTLEIVTAEDLKGATEIQEKLFYYKKSLKSVELSNTITHIRSAAFQGCSNLSTITIGSGVVSLNGSLGLCSNLKSIYYNGTAEGWCNIAISATNDSPFKPGANLYFKNASGEYELVTELVIPNTVTEIKHHAFEEYRGLTNVTFEENSQCASIGSQAFQFCQNLTSVTIPDSVTIIEDQAFCYCSNLTNVTIGKNLTDIKGWAFQGCTKLSRVRIDTNTPPNIHVASFSAVPTGCVFEVHNVTQYENATNWSDLTGKYVFVEI